MAKRKATSGGIADEVQPVFEEIAGLVDAFCRDHLNEEYAHVCRSLTEKLARKRPSPLVSGKPATWACGTFPRPALPHQAPLAGLRRER